MAFIARYSPHRQGLGTSLFFPNDVPAGAIIVTNVTATVVAGALAAIAVRNGRSIAEAMALDMLLLLGLSPTVSDQYLMWAFPFLLVAGRLRTASLLSLGLLPAVVSLDLWTSQGDGATPRALLLLATASLLLGAASLLRRPGAGQRRQEQLKPVTERAA